VASDPLHSLPIGRAELLREGADVALLAVGAMVLPAERAAEKLAHEGIKATVINARFIKPLDERLFLDLANRCGAVVTIEENTVRGGFGSGVLELLAANGLTVPVRTLGVPDRVFEQASQARLREQASLTPDSIAATARIAIEAARTRSMTAGASSRSDALLHS
jgi:1-deoxy-D-xylulose-5-phosphate synthase